MIQLNNKNIISISLVLSLLLSIFVFNLLYLFAAFFVCILIYYYGKNMVLALIIVGQVIVTGDELLSIRPYLTLISLIVLLYYFLSEYGFEIKTYPKVPKQVAYFIIFLLLIILLSTLHSTYFSISLLAFVRLIIFFLLCYLLYAQIKNRTTIYYYLGALLGCLLFLGISMFNEFIQKGSSFFVNEKAILRLAGVYENPNYVGLLIVITFPLTFAQLLLNKKNKSGTNVILIIFALLQISLLILSDSRASFLSITISLIALLFYSSPKVKIVFLSTMAGIFILLILFTKTLDLLDLYLRLDRAGTREAFWNSGLEIISNHMILGIGPDTFDRLFFSYSPSSVVELFALGAWTVGKPHPHNLFIYYWAENGVLGIIAVILFFSLLFRMIKRLLKQKNKLDENSYVLVISIFSITLGLLVRSMFEITGILTYGFITRDLPFWILIIILVYIYRQSRIDIQFKSVT